MNNSIKTQLQQVREADLSNYNEATNSYFIPKRVDIRIEENKGYVIELKDSLFSNNSSLDQLISNWNKGNMPKYKFYKIDVIKKVGNMININGIEYDPTTKQNRPYMWSGWLPVGEIEVKEVLQ